MHRLVGRLTDLSAVFLEDVHTTGLTAEAPPRGLQHAHVFMNPTYAQSFAEPDPPSSTIDPLRLNLSLFRMTAWIREVPVVLGPREAA